MLWLRHYALPNIDRYRGDIVSSIEKASGMAATVRSIRGGWEGLRPHVTLEGFALADRKGRVGLGFERAEANLSWWSLLAGQVHFHDVDFYRPALALRRGADGLIYLADKPLNAAGPGEGRFTEWLLGQPRLGIHDATLTWRDEKANAPEVELTGVQIAVQKHLGRYHAALIAVPPRELAGRIDMRADVKLERDGTRWVADGEVYVETRHADLGRLRAHLPVPETLRSGAGGMRVWVQFGAQGLKEILADLDMRDARARLAEDTLPLELATLSGRARYRVEHDGFSFATEGLRFRLASGVEARPGDFSLKRTTEAGRPARVDVRANDIDVKIAATLLEYFPVPRDVKGTVLRFAPRGRIRDALVTWSGEPGSPAATYTVKGRFEDLAINAVDNFPGFSGLTGRIEGTQANGTVELESKKVGFTLERIFRAPLALDTLSAHVSWKRTGATLEVAIAEAAFANADAEGTFAGTWRTLPDRPSGSVDVKGALARANLKSVAAYLPNRLVITRDWLERSIQAGSSKRASFEVRGDLATFPFADGSGRFVVEGDIRDGQLKYRPDWPSVDAVQGSFRFDGPRMEIRAERASIFASRATNVTAVIENLAVKPPLLVIDGDVDTSGADGVRFLRESPLVNGPGAFTRAVAIEGPGKLKLHLEFPLGPGERARVRGDYTFAGATASVAKNLAFHDMRGRLSFTERGVAAPEIRGTMFGKPALLTMSTQADGQILTSIDGHIDAPVFAAYVPEAIASRLSGGGEWQARIVSGRGGSELTVTSDLKGVGSALPAPLAKAEGEARPLLITMARLGQEGEVTAVALEGGIYGRFNRAGAPGAERWNAALKFGAPVASEPVREGVWLYGELPRVDVDAWQSVFAAPREEPVRPAEPGAMELRGLDLKLGEVHYSGRDFRDMRAQLTRGGRQWKGRLESPVIAGDIDWDSQGKGRLVAKLERLAIPESTAKSAADAPAKGDLPALDIVAERFDFRGRRLGKLDLKAAPTDEEWRIDKLDIVNEHSQFRSSGRFRRTAAGAITTLALKVETDSLNELFGQFGYVDYIKGGTGKLEGELVWPGYPYEFALANLAGQFKVETGRGQFAKIQPGAGKLLALISLQSLPRHATFDFDDVFSKGFAFEHIRGDVKIARGVMLTDNFEIAGPAAFVSLAGEVSLPQETQTLTMHIVPEVGEAAAVAATLIGTPVLGLSTLLVSKLLKNPLGKVVAYEYQIAGSWDNPEVTRLSAPPPKPTATTAAAAAK